jgi:4-nitrophenyl phosphatase
VAAVLLAAGGSTRFGAPKQLLDWNGRPLVAHAADMAWIAGLEPIIAVIGAEAEQVAAALEGHHVRLMRNYRWAEGMSTSLSVGLAALPAPVEAALFLPIDQPLLTSHTLHALVARWREGDADIVVARDASGQRGTPAVFARRFFPELARLSGDVGGRALFDPHADAMASVRVEDPKVLMDVDTPQAYARLRAVAQREADAALDGAIKGVICDMDGVLWRGKTPLPGLHAFFDLLRSRDLGHVLVTNNASHTPDDYVQKLAGMDVATEVEHVLNSAQAAADYLTTQASPGAEVYAIGGPGVPYALQTQGFRLSEGERADYVVVGWDRELTWQKLAIATRLIRDGAGFIGTNPDRTFPLEDHLAPGNGAQIAALEAATDREAVIAGKPAPILYRQAMARMGTTPETTLVIGDRLDTDILGGLRLGTKTALVLTGISQRAALRTSPIRPDFVFDDLPSLVQAWDRT